ncbi:MAG TPA: MFS transporter [Amycolatopsis sp.]|nr:MFS transporter [Amycolatopsis sp.]
MTASTTTSGVLAGRDFRLLWIGQSVSKTGSAVTTFALPVVAVRTLNASPLLMGVLTAMIWLPWLLVGLQAGAWADRRTKWPLMIHSQIVSAILIASIPVLAWLNALTMWYILVIAFAAGCANVVFTAAYNAYVPFLVGKPDLLGANSRLAGSEQVANVAGPGIGALINAVSSAVLGLVVDSASFLISALCMRFIRARETFESTSDRPRFRADVQAAIRFLVRDPYLRVLTVSSASANLVISGISALTVVFLIRTAGLSPWVVAADTVMLGVGGFLGAFLAPRICRRLGTARALLVSTPVTDAFMLLFPFAGQGVRLVLALSGVLVWATGVVMRNVNVGSFRQSYCPQGMVGRVAMTTRFVFFGVWPIGSLIGGVLGTVFYVRTALWILAGANVLADLWLFTGPIKRHRDLPTASAA